MTTLEIAEEQQKESENMNCLKLISTKNLDKTDWLQVRKQGIGGSDAGAIVGVNPYKSPYKVWLDKTENLPEDMDNERMRVGHDLEEYVAKRFEEATGKRVRRENHVLQHKDHKFMIANLDRVLVGENAFLECKTTNSYNKKEWEDGKIPLHYEVQCLHYMSVGGFDHGYIAVLIGNEQFVWYKIERDDETISLMIQREQEFWEQNVVKRIPPSPDGSNDCTEIIKKRYSNATSTSIILGDEFENKLKERDEIESMIKQLEKQKKRIDQEIQEEMKENEMATCHDRVISWKLQERKTVDTAKLKNDGLYNNYLKVSSSRVFKIK